MLIIYSVSIFVMTPRLKKPSYVTVLILVVLLIFALVIAYLYLKSAKIAQKSTGREDLFGKLIQESAETTQNAPIPIRDLPTVHLTYTDYADQMGDVKLNSRGKVDVCAISFESTGEVKFLPVTNINTGEVLGDAVTVSGITHDHKGAKVAADFVVSFIANDSEGNPANQMFWLLAALTSSEFDPKTVISLSDFEKIFTKGTRWDGFVLSRTDLFLADFYSNLISVAIPRTTIEGLDDYCEQRKTELPSGPLYYMTLHPMYE